MRITAAFVQVDGAEGACAEAQLSRRLRARHFFRHEERQSGSGVELASSDYKGYWSRRVGQ